MSSLTGEDGQQRLSSQRSIFLVGLTGAGKTTIGRWLSQLLEWTFIDVDAELQAESGLSCPDIVRSFGWAQFRQREALMLGQLMEHHPYKHVISCGGGIIETERARLLLKEWHAVGMVLLVHREVGEQEKTLTADESRMISKEPVQITLHRRVPWLKECSNYSYHNSRPHAGHDEIPMKLRLFLRQLQSIHTGTYMGMSRLDPC